MGNLGSCDVGEGVSTWQGMFGVQDVVGVIVTGDGGCIGV